MKPTSAQAATLPPLHALSKNDAASFSSFATWSPSRYFLPNTTHCSMFPASHASGPSGCAAVGTVALGAVPTTDGRATEVLAEARRLGCGFVVWLNQRQAK